MFFEWTLMPTGRHDYVCLSLRCDCVEKAFVFVTDNKGLSLRSYGTYYAEGNKKCHSKDCINNQQLLPNGRVDNAHDLLTHFYSLDVFTLTVVSTILQNQSDHLLQLMMLWENAQDASENEEAAALYKTQVKRYNETLMQTLDDLYLTGFARENHALAASTSQA